MTFTQIPQQYAPLGGELRYTVTAAAAGTIDLRITDTGSADLIGAPYEQSFKTLVMEGKSGGYYVFVVPIEKEVDRKAAAKAVGEKAVDMIHVKDILKITGYVRGGCSPLGMKKAYPTVYDASAGNFDEIYVSGGRIGLTLKVPLEPLLKVTNGKLADITMK